MNYHEWAESYQTDAGRILKVIEKKKALLNDPAITADKRKAVNDAIVEYRRIYRELLRIAELLRRRAEDLRYAA